MINTETLSRDWILHFKDQEATRKSDPALIEKMIFALYLLENLAQQNIRFVFKGGTSLVLLTKRSHRFSVDIDITTTMQRNELENAFHQIASQSIFESFTLDEPRSYANSKVPKAHYFFHYQSIIKPRKDYIMLDILFQQMQYPETKTIEIKSEWLNTSEPYIKVNTPSVNAILGDKLTAFAPNTTGVPYEKRKELEIVKQLFDVAKLIDLSDNFELTNTSFLQIAENEIRYRELSITPSDVLNDLFETALLIAARERNKGTQMEKFGEIKTGLLKISSYTINNPFRIEHATEAAAKAAWFAMKLKNHNFSPLKGYKPNMDLSAYHIENPAFQFLNKLKKSIKSAFYYWYHCLDETGQLN